MENRSSLASLTNVAYAGASESEYVAYVAGDYVPSNKSVLPGLIYAVTPGEIFEA
jgi:hypothetical protein